MSDGQKIPGEYRTKMVCMHNLKYRNISTVSPPKTKHIQVFHLSKDPDPTKLIHSMANPLSNEKWRIQPWQKLNYVLYWITDASLTSSVFTEYWHFTDYLTADPHLGMSSGRYIYKNVHNELLPHFNFKKNHCECLKSIKINETVDFSLIITSLWLSEKMYLFHVKPLITPSFQ